MCAEPLLESHVQDVDIPVSPISAVRADAQLFQVP